MEGASSFFVGGIVAYAESVKFDLLGVTADNVVTEQASRQMAEGVRKLTGADIGIGITGVGGPGPDHGQSPGTVFVCVDSALGGACSTRLQLSGDPAAICRRACHEVLELVRALMLQSTHTSELSSR